jgi:PAS domain S-box-containing protein
MPLRRLLQQALNEVRIVEQDVSFGQEIYAVTFVPISGEDYANIYGRNVTAHKKAEEALKESERRQRETTRLLELDQARLAAILRHLPVGVWIVDQQGRLTGSNPEADQIWAGEAPLLNSIAEYQQYTSWHPESGELLEPEEYPIAMALRTGEPVEPLELKIRRFDSSEGTVLASAAPIKDSQGQLTGVVGVNVDITDRKQAEAHVKDLLALNEKILNHSSVGILSYKVTGQCVFANEKVASIVGTSVAELLLQNFHTIQAWKESGLYDLVQQAISTQVPTTADIHHVSTFGKDLWITVHCITFQTKGEDHVLLSISDITERKKAEEALRKSEERFAKAFHASPNAILISRLSDGLIMEVNEGWSTIFGHKPDEVLGRTTLELGVYVNPEDRQKAIAQLKENGFLRDFDVQIRLKSGEIREASMSAERIEINGVECLLAIMQDITERKQSERALLESEQRLKRAQEIAHLGSWELDLVNNRLTWSDEVYRIFGLQPQEFGATYEAFLQAVHPEDRAAVDNAYSSSIREGRDSYEIEHRVVKHSSREVRIIHEKCEHFRDQSGQIVRSIGMVHDITERKQAEEQLKDYAERLERSNHELEQFAFMASHDLQEPLRKIEMFGDLLLERATCLKDRERNYLDRMRNAAARMRDMVTGLLQLSRITTEVRPFVSVSLSRVLSEVLSDMEEKVRHTGGKVEYSALPIVEGDPMQLRQLLQNLIGNALKYHQPDTPPDVKIYAKQLSEKAQIFVEDQGIGFDQENAERIFQPFHRLVGHSQYEGNGIGLSICRRIVERHAGTISATSTPGEGAVFMVTLPLAHPENAKNES